MSSLALYYSGSVGHAGQAALASMVDIANQTFDGFERLVRLNLQTMKTTFAEQHGIALEAVDSRSLGWMLMLPTAQAQAGFKKTLAYWQHVNEIAVETGTRNAGAGWEGFREYAQWLGPAMSEAAGTPPSGSFLLAASDTSLPVPAETEGETGLAATAKSGGKKRSVDIVDGSGNVVSSGKQ